MSSNHIEDIASTEEVYNNLYSRLVDVNKQCHEDIKEGKDYSVNAGFCEFCRLLEEIIRAGDEMKSLAYTRNQSATIDNDYLQKITCLNRFKEDISYYIHMKPHIDADTHRTSSVDNITPKDSASQISQHTHVSRTSSVRSSASMLQLKE